MDPWLASRYGGVSREDATGHYKWRGVTPRRHPDDEPPRGVGGRGGGAGRVDRYQAPDVPYALPGGSMRPRRARRRCESDAERRERLLGRVFWSIPVLLVVVIVVTALGWNPLV